MPILPYENNVKEVKNLISNNGLVDSFYNYSCVSSYSWHVLSKATQYISVN